MNQKERTTRRAWLLTSGGVLGGLAVAGCVLVQNVLGGSLTAEARAMSEVCERVRENLRPWAASATGEHSLDEERYARYFGLRHDGVSHRIGALDVDGTQICVQYFAPAGTPRGTVLLLHGYLDHVGAFGRFTGELCAQGWAVVAYDLPGHGLSGGARADIASFQAYRTVLEAVCRRVGRSENAPFAVVAHSTGCCAVMEWLQEGEPPFDTVVLLAPLVESYAPRLSAAGRAVLGPFVKRLPTVVRPVSHDEAFLEFQEHGNPLRPTKVPVSWYDALRTWQKTTERWGSSSKPMTIIQGTDDTVVAWKRNLTFLAKAFPNARIRQLDDARHHLVNEAEPWRSTVLEHIADALERESTPASRTAP